MVDLVGSGYRERFDITGRYSFIPGRRFSLEGEKDQMGDGHAGEPRG